MIFHLNSNIVSHLGIWKRDITMSNIMFSGHGFSVQDIWVKGGPGRMETEFHDPIWTNQESLANKAHLPSSEGFGNRRDGWD